jgi:hypothetical protein
MPQISLYIDKDTHAKIEKAAAKERISISKWIGKNIKKVIKKDYPQGYFDLFGSITDKLDCEINATAENNAYAHRRCASRPPRPKYEDGRYGTFSPPLSLR